MTIETGCARLAAAFQQAASERRCALMPYLTMGYPALTTTLDLVPAMVAAGADILELGVPFSDPIADGEAIQHATHVALQQETTPARCLEAASHLRARGVRVPFLLMGYYNPIFVWGPASYARACRQAGVDGLIVPDLPVEESDELLAACQGEGLALVYLVAPNTEESRLARIAAQATGFLYLVSRPGVTGVRAGPPEGLTDYVGRVRKYTRLPLALGFGISSPSHVAHVARLVDGVVVGSAIIERAGQGTGMVAKFVHDLRQATGTDHLS